MAGHLRIPVSRMNDARAFHATDDVPWQSILDLDRSRVPAPLYALLTDERYLTGRVRDLCGDAFELKLLAERPTRDGALAREILMFCGETPWVFGQTLAPAGTVAAQPWLPALGNASVGDRLRELDGVTRGALGFAWLPPGHRLARRAVAAAGLADVDGLWARRSLFHVASCPLLVSEVFLPGAGEPGR